MMKQWITISASVAAGILLAALVLFVLWSAFASFNMLGLNNMMGGTQGMMNGMSSMGNMNEMTLAPHASAGVQHMNGMMGGSQPNPGQK